MNQACTRTQEIQNIVCNDKNHIVLKLTSNGADKKGQPNSQNQSMYEKIIRRQSLARQNLRPTLLHRNDNIKTSTCQQSVMKQDQDHALQPLLQKIGPDSQLVPEYVSQCLKYMITRETKFMIKLQKLQSQPQYLKQREDIVDWICSVHNSMGLADEIFPIAINFLDRHLSATQESQQDYQLTALVCLFMAAKLEETYGNISMHYFLSSSRLKSNTEQIVAIEDRILRSLQFELIYDTPHKYLELFGKIVDLSYKNVCLGQFLIQLALTQKQCIEFQSSKMAASAIYSIHKIRRVVPAWPSSLQFLTGYKEADLASCVKFMSGLVQDNHGEFANRIRNKFSKEAKCSVSHVKFYRKIE